MHYRTKFLIFSTLAIVACSFGSVFADSCFTWMLRGGTPEPLGDQENIRLVRETVDLKLGKEVVNTHPILAHCTFEFRNDGLAADVDLRFPERINAQLMYRSDDNKLRDFKVWVDGKAAEVKYLSSSENAPNSEDPASGERRLMDHFSCNAWYTTKVHFNAGQTRKVVISYSACLGTKRCFPYSDGDCSMLGYILSTGANWKGQIERAVVTVDLSNLGKRYEILPGLEGYTAKNNKFIWRLENFEPNQDLEVSFTFLVPLLNGERLFNGGWWNPCFEKNGVFMASPGFIRGVGGGIEKTSNTTVVKYGQHTLKLTGGSKVVVLDGEKVTLKHAVWQEKGSDMLAVPLEEIVKLLGGSVQYDKNKRPNVILKSFSTEY